MDRADYTTEFSITDEIERLEQMVMLSKPANKPELVNNETGLYYKYKDQEGNNCKVGYFNDEKHPLVTNPSGKHQN